MFRHPSLAVLALASCALRPYTFGATATEGTTGEAVTTGGEPTAGVSPESTTGNSPDPSTSAVDGESSWGFVAGELDLGSGPPLWPPVPCEAHHDCPSGHCIDPREDYDQEYSDQRYCLARVPPELECNWWDAQCPEGTKCVVPTWDGGQPACLPVLPGALPPGSPCEKLEPYAVDQDLNGLWLDNCDIDSGCFGGVCRTFCEYDADFVPHCPPGSFCNSGRVSQWCIPHCDPLLQDCGEGQLCIYPNDGWPYFVCVEPDSEGLAPLFEPCQWPNSCEVGLICMYSAAVSECDQQQFGCCSPFCSLSAPKCPGAGQECLPYFLPGEALPMYEDVGFCAVPG